MSETQNRRILLVEDDVFERADGQVLWTRWECRPWYENDGSIGGIVINTEVIDRTQRLHKIFVENRDFLYTLLATSFEGFCIVDTHGRILEVNSAYRELTGYTSEELASMPMWQIDAYDDEAGVEARMVRIRNQGHERFPTTLRRKDGSLIDVQVSVSIISQETPSFVALFLPTNRDELLGAI